MPDDASAGHGDDDDDGDDVAPSGCATRRMPDPDPAQSASRTIRTAMGGGGTDDAGPPPPPPSVVPTADVREENRSRNRGLSPYQALSNSFAAPDAISRATRDGHRPAWKARIDMDAIGRHSARRRGGNNLTPLGTVAAGGGIERMSTRTTPPPLG
jgi:hypothetical protein